MSWNLRKLVSLPIQCISITNRVLSFSDSFTACYHSMTWNDRKLICPQFMCKVWKIVFLAYLTVLRLITTVWPEMSENSYLCDFSAQVSQIVFLAYLTALHFITTLWLDISEKSYFRDFSAQVSQIVFLAYLTVLPHITTVWHEMSDNSYLRDFSAQVSQIVFLAYLTVLRLITTVELKSQKTRISAISVHKYHKSFS